MQKKKDIAIQPIRSGDIINNGTDLNVVLKNLAQMGYPASEATMIMVFYGKPEEFKMLSKMAGMKSTVFTFVPEDCRTRKWLPEISSHWNGGIKALPLIQRQAAKYIVNWESVFLKQWKMKSCIATISNEIGKHVNRTVWNLDIIIMRMNFRK